MKSSDFTNDSVHRNNVLYKVKGSFKMLEQDDQRKLVKGHFYSSGFWSYFSSVIAITAKFLNKPARQQTKS